MLEFIKVSKLAYEFYKDKKWAKSTKRSIFYKKFIDKTAGVDKEEIEKLNNLLKQIAKDLVSLDRVKEGTENISTKPLS